MCKTVATYQQTFVQNNSSSSLGKFRLTRVLKEKDSQYFVVKCLGINKIGGNASELFLRNLPALTGKCNTQSNTPAETNHVYLGSLGDHFAIQPSFMVNQLPLNEFEIIRQRNGVAVVGEFAVSFQIEVKEAD